MSSKETSPSKRESDYRRYVLERLEIGTRQADAGQVIPHAEVAEKLRAAWALDDE